MAPRSTIASAQARSPGFGELGFNPVKAVAPNDAGTVAFLLEFAGPLGRSLYVGPDPVEDRVIGRGSCARSRR